ncbi:MAG: oxygen-independent coproporphyrinogen III oxidase [Pseudomonadota bacterium]|nr:MAG: oxygen-independent coproporphyrinogen III oxidase [Pseudomonadota bacterium]
MDQTVIFDAELLRRYDTTGPRYTSYPTAVSFHENFTEEDFAAWAKATNEDPIPKPLSLYFHIPFCDTVCFYCACNKIATKDRTKVPPYLLRLKEEMRLMSGLFDLDRSVEQLHWGGGTPTYLNEEQIRDLMDFTRRHFNLRDDDKGEYSIEVDPRKINAGTIQLLRSVGFNRISIGVQDFDETVQKAVNRIQPEEETLAIYEAARDEGFKSANFDLIYGLPQQSVEGFARTIDRVIEVAPDRIAVFNYAHLPEMFKPQRRIDANELPSPADKLKILQQSIDKLVAAGYVYIGMDHFAKPDDELAVAQRDGTLHRNFQGFSAHAECDLIAMGVSSISKVGDSYCQNAKTLDDYYRILDTGHLPIARGYVLNSDDVLRRDVIMKLICYGELNIPEIEHEYGIEFGKYFDREIIDLDALAADGLLERGEDYVRVRPAGRLLVRNIGMVFDKYLRQRETTRRFSRVI